MLPSIQADSELQRLSDVIEIERKELRILVDDLMDEKDAKVRNELASKARKSLAEVKSNLALFRTRLATVDEVNRMAMVSTGEMHKTVVDQLGRDLEKALVSAQRGAPPPVVRSPAETTTTASSSQQQQQQELVFVGGRMVSVVSPVPKNPTFALSPAPQLEMCAVPCASPAFSESSMVTEILPATPPTTTAAAAGEKKDPAFRSSSSKSKGCGMQFHVMSKMFMDLMFSTIVSKKQVEASPQVQEDEEAKGGEKQTAEKDSGKIATAAVQA